MRNVGEGLVGHIVAEREANGPYADFYDFCQRVDTQVLNKRTVESLIKAGAFDDVGHPRKGLLTVFEQIVDHTVARRRERDMGIMTLFGGGDDGGPGDDFERTADPRRRVRQARPPGVREGDARPLRQRPPAARGRGGAVAGAPTCTIDELDAFDDGAMKSIGGVITGLQRKWTRKGDLMAVFTLEDLRSSVEVMVFPRTMHEHGHKLADDAVVIVKGRVDKPRRRPQADRPEHRRARGGRRRRRAAARPRPAAAAVAGHGGPPQADPRPTTPAGAPVFLHLGERQVVRLPEQWNVDTSNGLLGPAQGGARSGRRSWP